MLYIEILLKWWIVYLQKQKDVSTNNKDHIALKSNNGLAIGGKSLCFLNAFINYDPDFTLFKFTLPFQAFMAKRWFCVVVILVG